MQLKTSVKKKNSNSIHGKALNRSKETGGILKM